VIAETLLGVPCRVKLKQEHNVGTITALVQTLLNWSVLRYGILKVPMKVRYINANNEEKEADLTEEQVALLKQKEGYKVL
jgi:hypothetical protein